MAELLLERPELVRGKRVVDLGAGCGVAGLAAALAGATEVLCTDGDAETVENLEHNIAANGFSGRVKARRLRWQDAKTSFEDGASVKLRVKLDFCSQQMCRGKTLW